jgi:hypothetical protein
MDGSNLPSMDSLSEFSASIITLMMEAVITSEKLVNFYETTWCNIPKDSHLQT